MRRGAGRNFFEGSIGSSCYVQPADDGRCPTCSQPFARGRAQNNSPRRKTRDHILPQCWGGEDTMHGDARNIRMICSECNQHRALVGHCVGAMACVAVVAQETRRSFIDVARSWLMQYRATFASPNRRH